MVRLIMSGSGEGKTKQLIELMENTAESNVGCMVCIEPKRNMSFNLRHQTRMIDASEFAIGSFEALRGFLSGLYAGNYDISHIFIDNLGKIVRSDSAQDMETFLQWMDTFGEGRGIKFTATISADPETATEGMRKYM